MRPTYDNTHLYDYRQWAIDNRDAAIAYALELGINDVDDLVIFISSQYKTQLDIFYVPTLVNYGGHA
jgi:hypothetical protein